MMMHGRWRDRRGGGGLHHSVGERSGFCVQNPPAGCCGPRTTARMPRREVRVANLPWFVLLGVVSVGRILSVGRGDWGRPVLPTPNNVGAQ